MNFFALFSVGFIMGLTGALAPGPLLTVTITESVKRGGIVGPLVVLGHGILEFTLLLAIVFGLGNLLYDNRIIAVVAVVGGLILISMGINNIRELRNYALSGEVPDRKANKNPIWAGIVVSLSNPYWFIWWLTIGMGYVIFAKQLGFTGVVLFFAGHILSDLLWYSFVSYGIQFGGKFLNTKVLKGILFVCSLFLVLFGLFFLVKFYKLLA